MSKQQQSPTCPSCGKRARGRFCADCGALTEAANCAACDAALEPGDRHCSTCGEPVVASGTGRADRTPWIVAGIAFAALFLVVILQKANDVRDRDALEAGVGAQPAVTVPAGAMGGDGGSPAGLSGNDLASMPPREMMDRLFDRVMRYQEEGKKDSVAFFAPMAMGLYTRPELQPLDHDLRYDFGTVANAAGDQAVQKAQSDTILAADPNHLLGLVMAIRVARAANDQAAVKRYEQRLVTAAPVERKRDLPEYQRHANEIDVALKQAQGN